ncbi:MAG: hypothetical protein EPO01_19360 [Aquabacterium sp.]|nr:MAG: hypothetical protein EPO01_19360 [Aquabacterium sp.]
MKPPDTSAADAAALFGSRNLPIHLARGALAATLLALAFDPQAARPVAAMLCALGALAATRGCPMCWTIGLIETLRQHRVRRR